MYMQAEEMILELCLKEEIRNLFKFNWKLDFNQVSTYVSFLTFSDICVSSIFVSDLMFNFFLYSYYRHSKFIYIVIKFLT